MPAKLHPLLQRLDKKARRGYRGDPVGTVAFYGPDDQRASKLVVAIFGEGTREIAHMRKWFSDHEDVREDATILAEALAFLEEHRVLSLQVTPGIFGCPHEEGVDYPDGEPCPQCPSWRDRDRHAIFRASESAG